ncbi:MAG: CheR family methyltransferase [Candidatus Dormibacteria bacterium]
MSQQPGSDASFEALLRYLFETHGLDFTGYKRASLTRRVQKRLGQLRVLSYDDYVDYLQVHPEEHRVLLDTILINVTSFYRDPASWDFLRAEILPRIVAAHGSDDAIRIWSAGCATGEEAYTAAMVVSEALGLEEFRRRVKVYATDVDEEALSRGRVGVYSLKELSALPEDLRDKYFQMDGQRGSFNQEMRRSVIFGRHDVLQDAPISRVDLLICRNTLMYFTADTQARVLARMHYAINDEGYLFAGRAEMLLTHAGVFTPVEMKHRIFLKVSSAAARARQRMFDQRSGDGGAEQVGRQLRLREAAFESEDSATIVVDLEGVLVMANQQSRELFGVVPSDVGRRLQDVGISYRPVELRSLIEQALHERRPVSVHDVERILPGGVTSYFDVVVTPLVDGDGGPLGTTVTFNDVTSSNRLQNELTRNRQELETAYAELQSSNEELETTNEELQSTVEELETTNEELQSANEELETMNEELQSTNSELQSINSEMLSRSAEIDRLNRFIESVLGSLDAGVIALDGELRVVVWNDRSADLWGLRSDEVIGQQFLTLDMGLPVGDLADPIRECLTGRSKRVQRELQALTRRGRTVDARVMCLGVNGYGYGGVHGVVLIVDAVAAREPAR